MYPAAASSVTLYETLRRIDDDLAHEAQSGGCPHCGGRLDRSSWVRKPRGCDLDEAVCRRQGLCCRDCRKRVLPRSTLFWGRKVYWGAVVLVSVFVRQRRVKGRTAAELRKLFGVSVETLRRWLRMFAVDVPRSATWRRLRGRVPPDIRDDGLPGDLLAVLDRTAGPGEAASVAFLSLWAG